MAVYISGIGYFTPLGQDSRTIFEHFDRGQSHIDNYFGVVYQTIHPSLEDIISELAKQKPFRHYDRATLLGICASRNATAELNLDQSELCVIAGSSRGATSSIERHYQRFLNAERVPSHTSPTTTSGIFASAIADDLKAEGLNLFVSAACTTSLHAVGMAYSLIKSDLAKAVLACGTEASLTDFTFAQLRALKIYLDDDPDFPYPLKPFHPERCGTFISEGACSLVLTSVPYKHSVAEIIAYGFATERSTVAGISEEGEALCKAIRMALNQAQLYPEQIDFIVGHGTGTRKGDAAELNAYKKLFKNELPPLFLNKYLVGHMLGAAGAFSLAMASEIFKTRCIPKHHYVNAPLLGLEKPQSFDCPRYGLVTSLGFGGNAGVVILKSLVNRTKERPTVPL